MQVPLAFDSNFKLDNPTEVTERTWKGLTKIDGDDVTVIVKREKLGHKREQVLAHEIAVSYIIKDAWKTHQLQWPELLKAGKDKEYLYAVYKYAGEPLTREARKTNDKFIVDIALQILFLLHDAYSTLRLNHRDIKLDNVVVRKRVPADRSTYEFVFKDGSVGGFRVDANSPFVTLVDLGSARFESIRTQATDKHTDAYDYGEESNLSTDMFAVGVIVLALALTESEFTVAEEPKTFYPDDGLPPLHGIKAFFKDQVPGENPTQLLANDVANEKSDISRELKKIDQNMYLFLRQVMRARKTDDRTNLGLGKNTISNVLMHAFFQKRWIGSSGVQGEIGSTGGTGGTGDMESNDSAIVPVSLSNSDVVYKVNDVYKNVLTFLQNKTNTNIIQMHKYSEIILDAAITYFEYPTESGEESVFRTFRSFVFQARLKITLQGPTDIFPDGLENVVYPTSRGSNPALNTTLQQNRLIVEEGSEWKSVYAVGLVAARVLRDFDVEAVYATAQTKEDALRQLNALKN